MQEHYEAYWKRENPPPLKDPLAETRAAMLFELMKGLPTKPMRFLDVGCGDGWLVGEAHDAGLDATGIDISMTAIEMARRKFPLATFEASEIGRQALPVEPGSFDIASSFEVIEHLLEPRALLSEMRDALRPKGHVAVTTPYHGLIKNLAIAIKGFDKHYSVTGDHIRFFSDAALKRMFEEHGFEILSMRHFGRVPLIWAEVFVWARKI